MSETLNPSVDDFAEMFEASIVGRQNFEDTVVTGTVTAIEKDMAIVDVGLKTEGRVPLREFSIPGKQITIKVGDKVEVFVERVENANGEAVISREKARREEAWTNLEKSFEDEDRVDGVIFNRVKGGFTVDLGGAVAFLPGSQVDIRPVRDASPLMNITQPFRILKMDKRRGNIVVSRRAILEEDRAEHREEVVKELDEGDVREGIVKNITDYGAFVELAPGVDGLLHVTDMSWSRVNHPSEVINVNDTIKVKIIKINPESHRISLGMKQLAPDPWEGVAAKYPLGAKFTGKVTNITDYGAFVELEDGIEGLVHVSEMSWVKKNVHPGKIVATSQHVEVMVLEVDEDKRRISLGLKQCADNPWENFAEKHPIGSVVEGEIKNITEFGLFIGIEEDMDGMVHLSDLDWNRSGDDAIKEYKKGDVVKAKILDVDPDKERIALGIKQLDGDPMEAVGGLRKGADVTCEVTAIENGGIEVQVGGENGPKSFIRKSDLSRDRNDQRPERFAVGDKVDARIIAVDMKSRRLTLSIKAREMAEEKEAVEQFGSADSGASLGDILGAALKEKDGQ
ncbi:30S ribosomal protein S1 [Aquisalinus flavus]|uniref:30S ribosomal protein S1 n=1 Tax=Aquisalinus flavus TaxID=1526572 RepID=A0A8J2Y6P5_9PROT|nr:30S ribosomal protein S1 [Aquisalinus flavus]MBD0425864.1 30S ribosomal protein S1 [Aquisalinus flavus]UNE48539.1 30S ribosomal protein S1 [Aquisalinus flavus]GGD12643.1 30S ribosomal protein S1 [Aquisalinus flavus]